MISASAAGAYLDRDYLPEEQLERIRGEKSRQSLADFIRWGWTHAVPAELQWSWYVDALADHLVAVHSGEIRRLLINMPFRTAKSTIVSVMFPAWCWIHSPGLRFFTATHTSTYAERDCWAARKLMRTPWYQQLITDERTGDKAWDWVGDQNEKGRYYNNRNGFRIATQVGTGTGEGGDVNVVDDPTTTDDAKSLVEREAANEWFFNTFYSRQNDFRTTRMVVMQQRQHPFDLSARILEKKLGYEHLFFPLEYRPHLRKPATKLDWEDPRTEHGQILDEQRFTPEVITELKKAMTPEDWEAQANQNPQHGVMTVVKPGWVKRWGPLHLLPTRYERLIQSWDCALKGKEKDKTAKQVKRSFVVGTVWGFLGARAYLLDMERGQWDLVDTCDALRRLTGRWPAATEKYIEDEANGPAIISSMQKEIGGLIAVAPNWGSKYARFLATQPYWKAGNVYVPEDDAAEWVPEYIAEITGFPSSETDDQVDSTSQALTSVWGHGGFDYAMGDLGAGGGAAGVALPNVPIEIARTVGQLYPAILSLCRDLMSAPASQRADRFWNRWGLIAQGRPLDGPRAETVITTAANAEDLAIAILAIAFKLEVDAVRPLVANPGAETADGESVVNRALSSLGIIR